MKNENLYILTIFCRITVLTCLVLQTTAYSYVVYLIKVQLNKDYIIFYLDLEMTTGGFLIGY